MTPVWSRTDVEHVKYVLSARRGVESTPVYLVGDVIMSHSLFCVPSLTEQAHSNATLNICGNIIYE